MSDRTIIDLAEARAAKEWSLSYVAHLPTDVLRDLALVVANGTMEEVSLLRQVSADLAEGIVRRRARQERESFMADAMDAEP